MSKPSSFDTAHESLNFFTTANQAYLQYLSNRPVSNTRFTLSPGRLGIYEALSQALVISEEIERCIRDADLRRRQDQEAESGSESSRDLDSDETRNDRPPKQ
jgi:hypothetical protein